MKSIKSLMLVLAMLFSTVQIQPSDNSMSDLIVQILSHPNTMPMAAAVAAGIIKQIFDISDGQNKTFNPLILEIREATETYGPSIAAGFQAAGGSIHVKVPNEMNIDSARAGFAPFMYIDCLPGSDKALINRTDADKQAVFSLRAGLGQNCKVEARCNVSNALWAGISVIALVAAQIAIAAVQPSK